LNGSMKLPDCWQAASNRKCSRTGIIKNALWREPPDPQGIWTEKDGEVQETDVNLSVFHLSMRQGCF
jgi:hypothetical protein